MAGGPANDLNKTLSDLWIKRVRHSSGKREIVLRNYFDVAFNVIQPALHRFLIKDAYGWASLEDVEDATQTAIIKFFEEVTRREHLATDKPMSWLFTVAKNALSDIKRKDRAMVELDDTIPVDQQTPDYLLDRAVLEIITGMDERRRHVYMYWKDGFTLEEIAGTLGIPETTVAFDVRKLKEELTEKLGKPNDR